jgi:predicted nucleic acid-binding protein
MITVIDTNVLIDIFRDDPDFSESSAKCIRKCMQEGSLVACDVVWAETAALFDSADQFVSVMQQLDIKFSPVNQSSAEYAGMLWKMYRSSGGSRQRVLSDFLIAAHSIQQCDRLLSRDRGFYRKYFISVNLLDPKQ